MKKALLFLTFATLLLSVNLAVVTVTYKEATPLTSIYMDFPKTPQEAVSYELNIIKFVREDRMSYKDAIIKARVSLAEERGLI